MRSTANRQPLLLPSLFAAAALLLSLAFALSAPAAHAQDAGVGSSTQYDSVIEYSTTSGYTFNNVNITWTNTNACGSFGGEGPGATWDWGPGVGATPCTGSTPPTGIITEVASSDGTFLANCTDTQGAATYGNPLAHSSAGCSNTGAGVVINDFTAIAYNASGNAISASSSGNDDWIIAVVVIIILILLLFLYMRRKRKTTPAATVQGLAGEAEAEAKKVALEAEKEAKIAVDKVKAAVSRGTTPAAAAAVQGTSTSTPSSLPPATAARFCKHCGSPVEPGAKFCPKCGKAL